MKQTGPIISSHGLDKAGLTHLRAAHWNYGPAALTEAAVNRGEVMLSDGGAIVALTGKHTGRSPKDKFIVEEATTASAIDWGPVNQPISEEVYDRLFRQVASFLQGREVFVQDLHACADPEHRLNVRVITQHAWHNLFARNMFIRPPMADLPHFVPDFTIIQAPDFQAIPERDGTRSECFIMVHFARRQILIGGTSYAGEIKKSIFGILNFLLPARGVLPMHCSANMGDKGDTALFFGLSGTGKTTLSSDASRTLIGDDEHGWSDNSVFNFEGGCYAKMIKLDPKAEPEIYETSRRFGTVLENVVMDPATRQLDLDDDRHTENTRGCYPIDFIPNASPTGIGGTPDTIVMLTADAFGVLPPVSKLTPEQTVYHFLSGYTARVAGTEKGVTEPQAAFSTCFGAVFIPRHPTEYAKMLAEKIRKHKPTCWLVNTGWSGGGYGVGQRMKIAHTRAMLRAALDGRLAQVEYRQDPNFGLYVPTTCPDVPDEVLMPRNTWADAAAYDAAARDVAGRFAANFEQYEHAVEDPVKQVAIRPAA